jgi:hypothetical protein
MAKKLALVLGIPRMVDESASPTIYDQTLKVVVASPGAGEILGPITAGTPITLPLGKTYTSDELEVYLAGDRMKAVFDYNFNSTTTVTFTFQLLVGDVIRFRIDRGA